MCYATLQEDFEKRAQSITAKSKLKAEIRFRAEVVSPAEWERCYATLSCSPLYFLSGWNMLFYGASDIDYPFISFPLPSSG